MNVLVLIGGVAGLAVAAYAFITLTIDAVRRRQYVDVAIALGVAVLVVYLLIAYGDRLIR